MSVSDGIYAIKNVFSGRVLGVKGGGGQMMRQSLDNGEPYQRWRLTRVGTDTISDYYKIVNMQSSGEELCLDVKEGSKAPETPILQYKYWGGLHQQWYLKPVPDKVSVYLLVARHSEMAIDVAAWDGSDMAKIQQFNAWWPPTTNTENQQWQL